MILRAAALVAVMATGGGAQTWRTVEVSRQLHDTSEHRVRVRYGVGRLMLSSTSDRVLFNMRLKYDEERMRPVHDYDADARSATLGIEGESIRWTRYLRDRDRGEMRLTLSNVVPIDLALDLGGAEARVDAGGLALRSLRIETGAADAVFDFSALNKAVMRRLDLSLGAASFVITNLGNANVETIKVEGGVGSVDLDFGAAVLRDVTVEADMAFGKLTLHLPKDVGIRVEVKKVLASFEHSGLYRRGDAYFSDNWDTARVRVRVRAQTVFGEVEVDRR